MKLKKLLAIFLVVALVVACGALLAACKPEAGGEEKVLRVAVVTSPSGVDDGNFNYDVWRGVERFEEKAKDYGYDKIQKTNVNIQSLEWDAALKPAIENIVTEYDVIILSGYQFGKKDLKTIAEANPKVAFMLIDSFMADENFNELSARNVYAVQFKEQESGFLAGVAAALQSTSKKVAVVNGIAYPSNINYQYGFYSGVNYVNGLKHGTEGWTPVDIIELEDYKDENAFGNYLGSFTDAGLGKNCGQALIAAGCDIIFVAAGGAGNGVFTAAKEATSNVKVIGCDANEWKSGYKSGELGANVVLTSALKVLNKAVFDALVDYSRHIFQGGQNLYLDAKGDYTGYVKEDGSQQLSAATIAVMDTAYAAIKAGTIVPAATGTENTFAGFAGDATPTPART